MAGWAWPLHGIFCAGRGWLGVLGTGDARSCVSQPAGDAEQ